MSRRYIRRLLALGVVPVIVSSAGCRVAAVQPVAATAQVPANSVAKGKCPPGMAFIESGSFMMGSETGDNDEKPIHRVTLAAYCMDLYEVAVEDFRTCVQAGSCIPQSIVDWAGIGEREQRLDSVICNWGRADRERHPINCVDWRQAQAYCAWAGKRLPTEQEWEYAARGSDGRKYPWGNGEPTPRLLNVCGEEEKKSTDRDLGSRYNSCIWGSLYRGSDGHPTTAPVGSFPAGKSAVGIHDLAGNVWEWTSSHLCPYPVTDCLTVARVERGGAWSSYDGDPPRATFRTGAAETYRDNDLGFRCARAAE